MGGERQRDRSGAEGGFLSQHISGALVLPPGSVLAETRDRLQKPAMCERSQEEKSCGEPVFSHCQCSRWWRSHEGDAAASRSFLWILCCFTISREPPPLPCENVSSPTSRREHIFKKNTDVKSIPPSFRPPVFPGC